MSLPSPNLRMLILLRLQQNRFAEGTLDEGEIARHIPSHISQKLSSITQSM